MSGSLPFLASPRRRSVLSRAVGRWRAGNYSSALDALVDESGNGLHARLGSSVGADSNDPLRLQYGGYKRLYFPGEPNNFVSTPNAAANRLTGDCEFILQPGLQDYTPGTAVDMLNKWATSNQSYLVRLDTNGKPNLYWTADGTTTKNLQCDAVIPYADGVEFFLKITLDVDNGAGGHTVRFYTCTDYNKDTDSGSWAQLGTDRTGAGTTAIHAGNATVRLGGPNQVGVGGEVTNGFLNFCLVKNGIGGSAAFYFDSSKLTEPYASWTNPTTGEVWTLNRSSSGRKLAVVDRDLLLLGSDDYLEVADHPLLNFGATHSMTLVFASRSYGTPAARRIFFSKRTDTGSAAGYIMYFDISNRTLIARVGDGTNNVSQPCGSASVAGQVELLGMIVNRENSTISAVTLPTISAASISPVGSMVSAAALAFGAVTGGATNPLDGEFIAGALFREALSAADLRRLAVEMGLPS